MKTLTINGTTYCLDDNGQNFDCDLSGEETDGIVALHICMNFKVKMQPKKVSLSFSMPALGADGVWSACGGLNRVITPDWNPFTVNVRSVSEYPILSVVSFDDSNVCTLSLSDAEKPCSLKVGYREERSYLVYTVEWFTDIVEEMEHYDVELTIDCRNLHFSQTVKYASKLLEKKYELISAPPTAFKPVFSTWYCFHQEVYRERLLTECREAKKLGLDTVIIDDGWQTEDNSRGYGFSGDYRPAKAKVGEICSLTNEIRNIGLKSMLWLSLAFYGDYARHTDKFGKMALYHSDDLKAYVVDPRFKEVREYIVSYCVEAVRDWGFDGLKLDFIDSFYLTKDSAIRLGTDCSSIEEGIKRLFGDLKESLQDVKKDVLIEFRQRYIGPAMQRLGNMLRVGDCPGSLVQNRVSLIDLRLISGEGAVHCDPIEWNVHESAENVARYLINCVFSTLQYSAYPTELTEQQRNVSKKYIDFMKEYEDVLQHGELIPSGMLNNYVACTSIKDDVSVIAVYADTVVGVDRKNTIILNGGTKDRIVVDIKENRYSYRVENCFGQEIAKGKADHMCEIRVPIGGFVYLVQV